MKEKYIQSLVFDVPHEDQVLKVYFELKYGANTAIIKPYFKSDLGHFPLSLAIGYESDDAPFDSEADLLEDITQEKLNDHHKGWSILENAWSIFSQQIREDKRFTMTRLKSAQETWIFTVLLTHLKQDAITFVRLLRLNGVDFIMPVFHSTGLLPARHLVDFECRAINVTNPRIHAEVLAHCMSHKTFHEECWQALSLTSFLQLNADYDHMLL
ncbi:hypothetical protein PV783_24785 [Chitinophaga sp. CC14]|uniref:hypothetical protein n=1 Tax=Chitinophaga sp. CC14 TaxID=3029199 RepID=UPI003B7E77E4